MKKSVLILFLLLSNLLIGQNLVPNPSFELIENCSFSPGSINLAVPWADLQTCDLFNICNNDYFGVPLNVYGNQVPFHGDGYAFFISMGGLPCNNYREYMQVRLSDTLIAGVKYFVCFRISLPENAQWATDGIGAFISTDSTYNVVLDSIPQIQIPMGVPITDMLNWTLVQGSFVAYGGETYLTIGNFNRCSQITFIDFGGFQDFGGYYVDGVSVSADSMECYNFEIIGVDESNIESTISIHPNPTSSNFTIEGFSKLYNISIYNFLGQLLYSENNILEKSKPFDVSQFKSGLIFIRIESEGEVITCKILKQ